MPATILDVLPLTDRIVVVHFAEGHVIHSVAGQPWGPETVVVGVLNTNAASQTNGYQISSTNDPASASALRPLQVGRKSQGYGTGGVGLRIAGDAFGEDNLGG